MPASVVDLGITSGSSTATLVLTTGSDVPAGSAILVAYSQCDNTTLAAGGSVTDSAGNTYASVAAVSNNSTSGVGFGQLFLAKSVTALAAGNSITLTRQNSSTATVLAALAVVGVSSNPLDGSVTQTNTGQSRLPSVTSGTPTVRGEAIVTMVSWQDNIGATFSQSAGFAAPFQTQVSPLGSKPAGLGGGNFVNADGSSVSTYTSSLSQTNRWAAIIVGLQPFAYTPPDQFSNPPVLLSKTRMVPY